MQADMSAAHPKHSDSLVGICAAIGEDFGFNPDILRVAVTASLLWNPVAVLIAYATAGLFVLASRRMFPRAKRAATPVLVAPAAIAAPHAELEDFPLARAA